MYVSIENRVVLITGASRGIGRATAVEMARAGAQLALVGRDSKALDDVVQEVSELGARAQGYVLDLRDYVGCQSMVDSVIQKFGTIDILVNNAAVGKYAGFLDLRMEDWERMLDTNVLGLVAVTQAVLPHMIVGRRGDIINISSIQGRTTTSTSSAYSATKFAVMAVTQSLQQEMRQYGIRITALCPGSVETDFDGFPGHQKVNPLTPQDVALAVRDISETGGRAYITEMGLMPLFGL